MTLWKTGRAVHSGQLARSKSGEDAVFCPSDMMLCVISYWVYYLAQNGGRFSSFAAAFSPPSC